MNNLEAIRQIVQTSTWIEVPTPYFDVHNKRVDISWDLMYFALSRLSKLNIHDIVIVRSVRSMILSGIMYEYPTD